MIDSMTLMFQPKQFQDLTDDDYMELAKILEEKNGRPYSLEEARSFGDDLITVMTTLANGRKIVAHKTEEVQDGHKDKNQT